jgi:SAM-dependent methyltransferase
VHVEPPIRMSTTPQDNRVVYDDPGILVREANLRHAHGWLDASEQTAVASVSHLVRGGRILDIGIGTGRTTELLTLLTDAYVGIDYAPRRVEMCRQRFPGVDLRVGDVRDLTAFDDGSFELVFFSFNGIDYVSHDERTEVLAAFHRILAPGGVLAYSTLNRDGASHDERPWQLHRPGERLEITPRKALRLAWLTATDPLRVVRRTRNWRWNRHRSAVGPEWSVRPLATLDFSLMQHFVSLRGLRAELATASLRIVSIYESEYERYEWPARVIGDDEDTSRAGGFQVVATRGPEGAT